MRAAVKPGHLTPLAAALLWVSTSVAAEVDPEASRWLGRMSDAVDDLSYEGILVYQHDDRLATMRLTHSATQKRERLLIGKPTTTISTASASPTPPIGSTKSRRWAGQGCPTIGRLRPS